LCSFTLRHEQQEVTNIRNKRRLRLMSVNTLRALFDRLGAREDLRAVLGEQAYHEYMHALTT
jgi:hypothetical protein